MATGQESRSLTRAASSRIELASILAMFDQVTTWAHFTGDEYSRPGVSVTLSAALEDGVLPSDLPKSGEEIEIRARLVTTGRTLGFASAQCVSGDGTVLASGTHHKYLPMDAVTKYWNFLFSRPLMPLALGYLNGQAYTAMTNDPDRGSASPFSSIEDVLDCSVENDGSLRVVPERFCGNPMGSVHGGFTAMLGAEATGAPSTCVSISASYLGAGKLGVGHEASSRTQTRPGGDDITSVVVYRDGKDDSPIFSGQYQCL